MYFYNNATAIQGQINNLLEINKYNELVGFSFNFIFIKLINSLLTKLISIKIKKF